MEGMRVNCKGEYDDDDDDVKGEDKKMPCIQKECILRMAPHTGVRSLLFIALWSYCDGCYEQEGRYAVLSFRARGFASQWDLMRLQHYQRTAIV
jgi:hypothetical protein